jgi:rod shape-determining protein MreC
MLAMAILLAGRSDLALFSRMRGLLLDALAPVAFAVSRPVEAGRDLARDFGDYLALKANVDRLRAENMQLQGWQDRARQLEAENTALRSLLKVPADLPARSVTARVVADASSGFMRGVIVLAGSDVGLAKGQAAMTEAGSPGARWMSTKATVATNSATGISASSRRAI